MKKGRNGTKLGSRRVGWSGDRVEVEARWSVPPPPVQKAEKRRK